MLLLFELLPTVRLVQTLRGGEQRDTLIAIAAQIVCAFPAICVWFGQRWAYVLGQYIAGIGAIGAIFVGFTQGFDLPVQAAIGLYGGLALILTIASPVREERVKAGEAEDDLAAWARENLEAVIVAFIMALLIRCFCIEVFKIPSSSMEPTLLGGLPDHSIDDCSFAHYHKAPSGDRIMVTKYYHAFSPVERYDVVVFKFPLNQVRNFIKRVVGLPDEEFFLDRGNIYTRPDSAPEDAPFTIARKPLRIQQSLWIRDLATGWEEGRTIEDSWRCSGSFKFQRGELRTLSSGETEGGRNSAFTYRSDLTRDEVAVAFDLELRDRTGAFEVEIPNDNGRFTLRLTPDQACAIDWRGTRLARTVPLRLARLDPDRKYRVEFMVYDGVARAIIDGRMEAELAFIEKHDDLAPADGDGKISFGARSLLFTLSNLTLGRDVYYKDKPGSCTPLEGRRNALAIKPEHYVMMGDNVDSSHDSRAWEEHTFVMTDGRTFRCESQENKSGNHTAKREWADRTKHEKTPDYYIQSDHIGYERAFNGEDLAEQSTEPAPLVHGKYIIGKALWIWWPPQRWFRLIK